MHRALYLLAIATLTSACSGSGASEHSPCSLSERTGEFHLEFTEVSGDCGADAFEGGRVVTDWLVNSNEFCQPLEQSVSADSCEVVNAVRCDYPKLSFTMAVTSVQDSDDGSLIVGLADVTVLRSELPEQPVCKGAYSWIGTRLPR